MILVTGATGNIGSEVVRLLLAEGARFRALLRDPAKAEALVAKGVEVVIADLGRPETLPAAFAGVEKLFLVAPLATDQVEMRRNAIRAAKAAGVRQVVMSTGLGADPDSPFRLGRMHGENQRDLQESGMAWTFLQPTFFMQNLLMSAAEIRDHGTFHLPLDGGRVSWIDARDIAAVGVRALLDGGFENRALPLTGPEALGGEEMARIFTDVLGREVRYLPVRLEDAKRAMRAAGMPEELAEGLAELWALAPAGHLAQVLDTVERVTGRPARGFREFVSDHRAAFGGRG